MRAHNSQFRKLCFLSRQVFDIVAILPPNSLKELQPHILGHGQIAGMVFGILMFTTCLLVSFFVVFRHKKKIKTIPTEVPGLEDIYNRSSELRRSHELENTTPAIPELGEICVTELNASGMTQSKRAELACSDNVVGSHEMLGSASNIEGMERIRQMFAKE